MGVVGALNGVALFGAPDTSLNPTDLPQVISKAAAASNQGEQTLAGAVSALPSQPTHKPEQSDLTKSDLLKQMLQTPPSNNQQKPSKKPAPKKLGIDFSKRGKKSSD